MVETREDDEDYVGVWLIDWEEAGWFPEYWEYVKGLASGRKLRWIEFFRSLFPAEDCDFELDLDSNIEYEYGG